jgi:uncharacterized protein (DUF885 family)
MRLVSALQHRFVAIQLAAPLCATILGFQTPSHAASATPAVGATAARGSHTGIQSGTEAGAAVDVNGVGEHASSATAQFAALVQAHDDFRLVSYPEYALRRGVKDFAGMLTDTTIAGVHRRRAAAADILESLRAVDTAALSAADRLDHALLVRELALAEDGFRFGAWMMPVGGRSGPHQSVAQMGELATFAALDDYEAYIQRLRSVPGVIIGTEQVMRAGVAAGVTPPKVTVLQVPAQISAARRGMRDALRKPFVNMPASIDAEDRAKLLADFERTLEPIDTALALFELFVRDEYLPQCRETIGAREMKDGLAWYEHQLEVHTTTDRTAADIHATGLAEVARIRAEMMEVIAKTDWYAADPARATLTDDARFAAFITYLRTDPRFYCTSAEELLARYREVCKRIDPKLPALFQTLPRLTYGVREIPRFMAPAQTTAYYQPGSPQRGEPGWFYANTYALEQRPTYEFVPLSLHEAVPGHHFQIALAQELEGVREFRKDLDSTAFIEGWALYAERLGIEMGLFTDPYDDFGRLLYEMWRATRLVVDTGIHAFGWTREQAIEYMRANTALSELNITNEVDRYIGWPGQATGYKIGEIEIRALRTKAEAALGKSFNIRRFHDAVLLGGPLPLDVLARNIDAWIEAEQRTHN